ncbi:MAG: methyltransferase domain-containing protein [Phycisphaerales bacterium]
MPGKTRTPPQKGPQGGDAEYILGTGDHESDRLGLQHRLWAASAHQLWERAGLQPGMTVLDVGCGPGHATMDLAEIVGGARGDGGGGRVVAIDESPLYLKHLHNKAQARSLSNIERILGDAQELATLIPQHAATFDLAYARWLLCFVSDPAAVVAGVATMLKPGGAFAIQDYFNYEAMTLAPRSEPFARAVRAIGKSWRDRGGDPDIVARLPAMLRAHGLEVADLRINQRVATPHSTIWAWPDAFWKSYIPRLVVMGYLTEHDQHAFEAAWSEASSDPDAFMMLPPVYDLLAIKP